MGGRELRTGPSVFLRSDGRWEARYQKGRDENGKVIYGFVYGKTQEEAERKRAEALRGINPEADKSVSVLASVNPNAGIPVIETPHKRRTRFKYDKLTEPLDEEAVGVLDGIFFAYDDTCAIAFYLSLHMGLSLSECAALRFGDIDLKGAWVQVKHSLSSDETSVFLSDTPRRDIPIPYAVMDFLKRKRVNEYPEQNFVFTNSTKTVPHSKAVAAAFRRLTKNEAPLKGIAPTSLRCTFVRRCLQTNLNIETVAALTGIEKEQIYKYFRMYIKADMSAIHRVEMLGKIKNGHRQLNLLILGAGSHGRGVKEIADRLGVFQKIRFLDDSVLNSEVIGKCGDCYLFTQEYPCAFVAIGDNSVRKRYAEMLEDLGFMLPTLIHPDATVSQGAEIGEGSIIMAQATVNKSKIGKCCIVESNAIVSYGAETGSYCHIDCGAMIMKNTGVPEMTTVNSGDIYRSDTAYKAL